MALNEKCLERCPDIYRRNNEMDKCIAAAASSDPNNGNKYPRHSLAITRAGCMLLEAVIRSLDCAGPEELPGDHPPSTTPRYVCGIEKAHNGPE